MVEMVPKTPLAEGETVRQSFRPDRGTYLRDQAWMAALAMAGGMAILWFLGNPHVWTGAVGGLAAIAIRGWYLASEVLSERWDLTDRQLLGPGTRAVALAEIRTVRRLGSAVQVITAAGDKHLIKHQPDPAATQAALERAAA